MVRNGNLLKVGHIVTNPNKNSETKSYVFHFAPEENSARPTQPYIPVIRWLFPPKEGEPCDEELIKALHAKGECSITEKTTFLEKTGTKVKHTEYTIEPPSKSCPPSRS